MPWTGMEKPSIRNGLPLALQKAIHVFPWMFFPVATVILSARKRLSSDT